MLPTLLLQGLLRLLRELLRSLRVLLLLHNHYFLQSLMDPWRWVGRFCLFLRMGSHRELRPFKVRLPVQPVQRVVELLRSSSRCAIVRVLATACPTPKTTSLRLLLLQFQVWLRASAIHQLHLPNLRLIVRNGRREGGLRGFGE